MPIIKCTTWPYARSDRSKSASNSGKMSGIQVLRPLDVNRPAPGRLTRGYELSRIVTVATAHHHDHIDRTN